MTVAHVHVRPRWKQNQYGSGTQTKRSIKAKSCQCLDWATSQNDSPDKKRIYSVCVFIWPKAILHVFTKTQPGKLWHRTSSQTLKSEITSVVILDVYFLVHDHLAILTIWGSINLDFLTTLTFWVFVHFWLSRLFRIESFSLVSVKNLTSWKVAIGLEKCPNQ